ncbi:hypothetical protein CHH79_09405 [Bacillus siamensis]|nr:hypothetical protein CHH79_09405 [Bacillus siamensis]PIK29820.1 hypothetical protein CS954_15690 [Bacillus siamensis]
MSYQCVKRFHDREINIQPLVKTKAGLYNICNLNVCEGLTIVLFKWTKGRKVEFLFGSNSYWTVRTGNRGKRCRQNYTRSSG